MVTSHKLLAAILLALILPSCKKLQVLSLEETLPTARFKKATVAAVQPETDGLVIHLKLWFEYSNPFNKPLPVPEHEFSFGMNSKTIQRSTMPAFKVPAKGSTRKAYDFSIDLTGNNAQRFASYIGKDNVYEFKSKFRINLNDLLDELPKYNIVLPESEKVPEATKEKLQNYLNEKLGEREFELAHSDTLRIPAFPEIRPAIGQPIQVRFVGQMESLNLQPVKDAIVPMGNLLVNSNFSNSMADPFVKKMESTTVTIPAPTATEWFRTKDVKLADYVLELLDGAGFDMEDEWEDLKSKMIPDNAHPQLMDHLVNVYFSKLNPDAPNLWANYKNQWQNFVNTPGFEIQYPGPNVTGLQVEIPFEFKNNNEFPITAPGMSSAAILNNGTPVAFSISVDGDQPTIDGNQTKTMKMVMTLNWQAASQGMLSLINGQSFQPNLNGEVQVDMGYGPMKVEIDIQQMLMMFGE
jgi:LEA14-like dessication related protein